MFNSRLNRPTALSYPTGNGREPLFEERVIDGKTKLVKVGEDNRKDYIEAAKESSLVENIIKRFQSGDITALNQRPGFYADISSLPNSPVEAHRFINSLQNRFDNLPANVREKFSSFEDFVEKVSSFNVDDFVKTFSDSNDSLNTENKEESNNE